MKVMNLAEPVKVSGLRLQGVSAEAAVEGGSVEVIVRAAMISTQSFFHRVAPNLVSVLEHRAREAGHSISLYRASSVLVVIRPNDTADIWVDTAATKVEARLKRDIGPGRPVFEDDIADITEMWFPAVDIGSDCRLIYLFREGFRFALVFDLRTDQPLDIQGMKRTLALLSNQMRYADIYALLASQDMLTRMIGAGWFPFIEIMKSEFQSLSGSIESGLALEDAEAKLAVKFTTERVTNMLTRWVKKEHFAAKEDILREGVEAFIDGKWVSCLKIMLTEIEGLIAEAYNAETGKRTRDINKLLDFAVQSAVKIAGGNDTLFFPVGFGQYLREYTFADSTQRSASRHSVGHGRAKSSDYTHTRALQALLTLDQLAFYS